LPALLHALKAQPNTQTEQEPQIPGSFQMELDAWVNGPSVSYVEALTCNGIVSESGTFGGGHWV
jgi:hypothetical protein